MSKPKRIYQLEYQGQQELAPRWCIWGIHRTLDSAREAKRRLKGYGYTAVRIVAYDLVAGYVR